MSIALFRKFGLHASADALAARDAYREGKTCRTCVHLDSDPRDEPCATCRGFGKWQGARAEQSKAPNGVAAVGDAQPYLDAMDRALLERDARNGNAAAREKLAALGVPASDKSKGGA